MDFLQMALLVFCFQIKLEFGVLEVFLLIMCTLSQCTIQEFQQTESVSYKCAHNLSSLVYTFCYEYLHVLMCRMHVLHLQSVGIVDTFCSLCFCLITHMHAITHHHKDIYTPKHTSGPLHMRTIQVQVIHVCCEWWQTSNGRFHFDTDIPVAAGTNSIKQTGQQ